jgi:hypothetical protein
MKNGKNIIFVAASTGFLSMMSFTAMASPSTTETFEKLMQAKAEQKRSAEEAKYNRIVTLAGSRQDDLTARKNEVTSAYKQWHDLKYVVVSHYPNLQDFKNIEIAAKTYSQANKSFVDLQKSILAQNSGSLDAVAINSLLATSPTAAGMK